MQRSSNSPTLNDTSPGGSGKDTLLSLGRRHPVTTGAEADVFTIVAGATGTLLLLVQVLTQLTSLVRQSALPVQATPILRFFRWS